MHLDVPEVVVVVVLVQLGEVEVHVVELEELALVVENIVEVLRL